MTGNATPTSRIDSDRWVRRFHPAPDAPARLVCLPHAGGSASFYFPVSGRLSPAIDVLAIQYPGRQDRRTEKCVETVEAMADGVVEAIRPWTDVPIVLFGHSMGASVAFEVALRLEAAGITPSALFVSGRRAPSRYRDEQVHLRDDDGLIAEIKALSGTASQLLGDDEVLRMVLPAIRSDYRAAETYRYPADGTKVSCPIYTLIGDNDAKSTVDEAESWRVHTTGEFTLRVFPGGHFYLNSCSGEVMDMISAHVDNAGGSNTGR